MFNVIQMHMLHFHFNSIFSPYKNKFNVLGIKQEYLLNAMFILPFASVVALSYSRISFFGLVSTVNFSLTK